MNTGLLLRQLALQENAIISCHEHEIPLFVGAAMEKLYENCFSSTSAEHIDEKNTSTYTLIRNARIDVILLFKRNKNGVTVLNGDIFLSSKEIEIFSRHIFKLHRSARKILFQSIFTDLAELSFPHQRYRSSEDIILALPDSAHDYLGHLGKSTRKYIKYHLNRCARHFPGHFCKIYEKHDISEQTILDIINLNTARMRGKNRSSSLDEAQKRWLLRLAPTYGFVAVTLIDGRIAAGVICSRVGKNYFMHVIAHDPAYDDYRLGMLCCYQSICEAIRRGGAEYHFLWGEGEYKYRLAGVKHDLYNVVVYRSRKEYFLQFYTVVKHIFAGAGRQMKSHLKQGANGSHFAAPLLRFLFKHLSALHRLCHGKNR